MMITDTSLHDSAFNNLFLSSSGLMHAKKPKIPSWQQQGIPSDKMLNFYILSTFCSCA